MSKAPERWSILKSSMYTMCTKQTKLLYSSKDITQQSSSNYDFSSNFVFTHGIPEEGRSLSHIWDLTDDGKM